jgi:hypothetical protein
MTCTCQAVHANHVHDAKPCTVRCPACCLATWTTPDPAARSHRPDAQTAQIAEETL